MLCTHPMSSPAESIHRIVSTVDAAGWRPSKGELDRYGRKIPDEKYHTKDFEKIVALRIRTEAIAKHLVDFMEKTGDRLGKILVFCVDQEHADEMRRALNNLNADLVKDYPDYVCRVTSDEGKIGRGHLSRFQELEKPTPVILTSSKLLSTGVDAPMVKNVALVRVVGSMTKFKQIIDRGRVSVTIMVNTISTFLIIPAAQPDILLTLTSMATLFGARRKPLMKRKRPRK